MNLFLESTYVDKHKETVGQELFYYKSYNSTLFAINHVKALQDTIKNSYVCFYSVEHPRLSLEIY